jgi:hypothetical protein
VGIQYLVDGWWWDIFENLVYYGDPDIVMFTPNNALEKPVAMQAGTSVNGHNFYGAREHSHSIGVITLTWIIVFVLLIVGGIAATIYIIKKKNRGPPGKADNKDR